MFNVNFGGWDRFKQKLEAFEKRVKGDYYQMWVEVTRELQAHTRYKFDVLGPGWRPTSDSFREWKVAHGYLEQDMQMTGNLLDSLTAPFGAHQYAIWNPQPHRLLWGTSAQDEKTGDPYAWWWNYGPDGRPFLVEGELKPIATSAMKAWLLRTTDEVFR